MRVTADLPFMRALAVTALVLLPGCGAPKETADRAKISSSSENGGASALESLAADSGVIGETSADAPTGSYGRIYDGGEDRLCVREPNRSGDMVFAAEIRIGDEEYCRGRGMATPMADRIVLRFAGASCTITARYEGDRIVLPGAVEKGCASLCNGRGSFAGVDFPRSGFDDASARSVRARDGKPLCGS